MNADPLLRPLPEAGSDVREDDAIDETATGTIGVFGHYRLDEEIGRGGMGVVYRAYDTRRHRIVAIKRMPRHLAMDQEFRTRFQRESALAAKLREPHVVPIHDYGEIDGQLYIDMRLVEGIDLGSVLKKAPVTLARAVDIVSQIADALDAAHDDGLVHRDVKPSNVLLVGKPAQVADRGFAYLADFGIAANLGGSTLSRPGLALGTASYMAPERMVGEPWDHRVDVYALACVLFEAVVGRRPYPAEDLLGVLHAHLQAPPPRPSELVAGLPVELDEVIARGMAKKSDDRYDSCGEFAEAARALLEGRPPAQAPPVSVAPALPTATSPTPPVAGSATDASAPSAPHAPVPEPGTVQSRPGGPPAVARPTSASVTGPGSTGPGPIRAGSRGPAATGPTAAAPPPVEARTSLLPPTPPTADPRTSGPTRWVPGPGTDPATVVRTGPPVTDPSAYRTVVANNRPAQPYAADEDVPDHYPTGPGTEPRTDRRRRRGSNPLVAISGAVLAALALAAGTVLAINLIQAPAPPLVAVDFLPTGAAPAEIALTPDGSRAYVTNRLANSVSVLDTATGQAVGGPIAVGVEPNSVRVAGNGRAYVTNQKSGTVSVIDTATNTVSATMLVRPSVDGLAVSPDNRTLYVGIADTGTVVAIDTETRFQIGAPIKVGNLPYGMAISADGSRLYVPNLGTDDVSVIDTKARKVLGTVKVGDEPVGVAVGTDGRIYVANQKGGTVSILDPSATEVVGTVAVGPTPVGIAMSGDGSRVYVSSRNSDSVRVLTTAATDPAGAVSTPVAVGAGPVSIAVSADERVFVVGERANAISVLRPGQS